MIIGDNAVNKLECKIQNTDKVFTFYYRIPTIDEWIDYNQQIIQALKGNPDLSPELVKIRIEAAMKVLEGIEDGQFEIMVDGVSKPLSSDPKSQSYHPRWKEFIKKQVYYLLVFLTDEAYRRGEALVEKKS